MIRYMLIKVEIRQFNFTINLFQLKNLALLIILLTFLGCTKFGKNITVKGCVLNPITGQGIEGVTVELLKGTLGLPGGLKSVKEVTTDANGNFEISKLSMRGLSLGVGNLGDRYAIGWYQDGQITVKNQNPLNVDKGKTMHVDFHAVEYGNYQIQINNVNCQGPNDTIIINRSNQVSSFLDVDWVLTGCDGYITANQNAPMGSVYTKYTVIRNGISQVYTDTFYINPGVDNLQVINY